MSTTTKTKLSETATETENETSNSNNPLLIKSVAKIPGLNDSYFSLDFDSPSFELSKLSTHWTKADLENHIQNLKDIQSNVVKSLHSEVEKHYSEAMKAMEAVTALQQDVSWTALSCSTTRTLLTNFHTHVVKPHIHVVDLWKSREKRITEINTLKEISVIENNLQQFIPESLMSLEISKAIRIINDTRKMASNHRKQHLYSQVLDHYEQQIDPILSNSLGLQLINFNHEIFEKIVTGYFVRDDYSPKQFFMDFSNQADSILRNTCSSIVAWHLDHSSNELFHMYTTNQESGKTTCAAELAVSDWALIHAHAYLNVTSPKSPDEEDEYSSTMWGNGGNGSDTPPLPQRKRRQSIPPEIAESLGLVDDNDIRGQDHVNTNESTSISSNYQTPGLLARTSSLSSKAQNSNFPNSRPSDHIETFQDFIPLDYSDWFREYSMIPSSFNPLAKALSKNKTQKSNNQTEAVAISDLLFDEGDDDSQSPYSDVVFVPRRYRYVCRMLCLTRSPSGSSHKYSTLLSTLSSMCATIVELLKIIKKIIHSFENSSFEFFDQDISYTSGTGLSSLKAQHKASQAFCISCSEKLPSILESLVKQSQILLSSLLTCPPIDEISQVNYFDAIKSFSTDLSDPGSPRSPRKTTHDDSHLRNKSSHQKKLGHPVHVTIKSCNLEAFTSFSALVTCFSSVCSFLAPESSLKLLDNALALLSQRYLEYWHTQQLSNLSNYIQSDSWMPLPTDTLIPSPKEHTGTGTGSKISKTKADTSKPFIQQVTFAYLEHEFESLSSIQFSPTNLSGNFDQIIQNSSLSRLPVNFLSTFFDQMGDSDSDSLPDTLLRDQSLISQITQLNEDDLSLYNQKLLLLPRISENNPFDCLTIANFTQKLSFLWCSYTSIAITLPLEDTTQITETQGGLEQSESENGNVQDLNSVVDNPDDSNSIPTLLSSTSDDTLSSGALNLDIDLSGQNIGLENESKTTSANQQKQKPKQNEKPPPSKPIKPENPFHLTPTVTQSTFQLIKLFPKYLKFMYFFPALAPQLFVAFTQLLDYTFYSIFLLLGNKSAQLPCTHFKPKEPGLSLKQFTELLDSVVEYSELFKQDSTPSLLPDPLTSLGTHNKKNDMSTSPVMTDFERATQYANHASVNVKHLLFDSKTSTQLHNCISRWHLLVSSSYGSGATPPWVSKFPGTSTFSIRIPPPPPPLSESRPVQKPTLFCLESRFVAFQALATLSQFIYGIQPLLCGTVLFNVGSTFKTAPQCLKVENINDESPEQTRSTTESNDPLENNSETLSTENAPENESDAVPTPSNSQFDFEIVESVYFAENVEKATMCQVSIRAYYQQIVASLPSILGLFFRNIVSNPGFAGGGFLEGRHHSDFFLAKHALLQKLQKPSRNLTTQVAEFYRWFSLYGPPPPTLEITPWEHHSTALWKFESSPMMNFFTTFASAVKLGEFKPLNLKWLDKWNGLVYAFPPRAIPITPLSMMISADSNWEKPVGHHHQFVDLINHEALNLHSLLESFNSISMFTQQLYWSAVTPRLYLQILHGISTVTKCTDDGRGSMKLDIFDINRNLKILLTRETPLFSRPRPIPFASRIDPFINVWFMDFSLESNQFFAWCDSNHKHYAPPMLSRIISLKNAYDPIDTPLSMSDMEAKINTYYARTRLGSVKDYKWTPASSNLLPKSVHLGNTRYSFPSILPIKSRHGFKLDLKHISHTSEDGEEPLDRDRARSKTLRGMKSLRNLPGGIAASLTSRGHSMSSDNVVGTASASATSASTSGSGTKGAPDSKNRSHLSPRKPHSNDQPSLTRTGSKIATFGKSLFRRKGQGH